MATLSDWDTSSIKPMSDKSVEDWDTENVSDMSQLGQTLTYVHHSADGSLVYCRNGQELRRAKLYDTVWVLSPGLVYLAVGVGMAYLANLF